MLVCACTVKNGNSMSNKGKKQQSLENILTANTRIVGLSLFYDQITWKNFCFLRLCQQHTFTSSDQNFWLGKYQIMRKVVLNANVMNANSVTPTEMCPLLKCSNKTKWNNIVKPRANKTARTRVISHVHRWHSDQPFCCVVNLCVLHVGADLHDTFSFRLMSCCDDVKVAPFFLWQVCSGQYLHSHFCNAVLYMG